MFGKRQTGIIAGPPSGGSIDPYVLMEAPMVQKNSIGPGESTGIGVRVENHTGHTITAEATFMFTGKSVKAVRSEIDNGDSADLQTDVSWDFMVNRAGVQPGTHSFSVELAGSERYPSEVYNSNQTLTIEGDSTGGSNGGSTGDDGPRNGGDGGGQARPNQPMSPVGIIESIEDNPLLAAGALGAVVMATRKRNGKTAIPKKISGKKRKNK